MTSVSHPHPRRQRRARTIALGVGVGGILVTLLGFAYLFSNSTALGGWPIGLVVMGITADILAPIWYFSYMETLEPELYEHEAPQELPQKGL